MKKVSLIVCCIILTISSNIYAKNCCPFMGKVSHCNEKLGRYVCSNGMPSPTCLCGDGKMQLDLPQAERELKEAPKEEQAGTLPFQKCYEQAPFKADPSQCQDLEYAYITEKLNKNYQSLMAKLNEERKLQLAQAMKDWVQYKESYCKFSFTTKVNEKITNMVYKGCLIKETLLKQRELETLLTSQ